MLVLDGLFTTNTDLGRDYMDHEKELPMLFLGLPGRLLNLGGAFDYEDMEPSVGYIDYHYLADTWVALFDHDLIRDLCDEDREFGYAVRRNMLALIGDVCRTSALFRSNYLHLGLHHLVQMLEERGQYINQQQLADLLNCDRTSVSKAFARMKTEHPEKYEAYLANKGRAVTRPYPGDGRASSC